MITYTTKNKEGFVFTSESALNNKDQSIIGKAKGYSIIDPKTMMNKYTIADFSMMYEGVTINIKSEIKLLD